MDDISAQEVLYRYEAPNVLQLLKGPSAFLRGQYSTNFADLVSKETEVRETYEDGLVALSCFLGGFVVIWGLVLVFFMLKGKAVGCASGRAFEKAAVDDYSRKGSNSSDNFSQDETHSVKEEEEEIGGLETESFSSSLCSSDAASRFESTTSFDEGSIDASPRAEGPRAMRTRFAFFLFACTVLACVPLALAFSFAPMKETTKTIDGSFDDVDDVIVQVRAALSTISTASQSAMGILSQTSTNFSSFCPNINNTQFDRRMAANLLGLSQTLSVEYVALQNRITENMTQIEGVLETVEDAAEIVEVSFSRAESVIWLVPGLLLAVSILTALATFGVILAWKHESGLRLQRCMSYGVLPALTALCLLCWILGIGTTVSTAMSADFCLSGSTLGTPDATIRNMLLTHGDLPNSTKHQFIGAYTSGCTGSEPALLIVELERASQDKVDEIWAHISAVDSFGRSALSEQCGGSGLDELLSASRNIAKLLTKVRRALDSTSDSLVCERIDPLYTATIHGTICTDFAEASAWGAITFCLLGISMMVLITLRASWRLRIDDDKIYHDESEVAENMIVDEHEEYLRYISKYRHEWQEYNGFGSASMKKSTSFSASEEEDVSFDSQSGSVSLATSSISVHERLEEDDTTSIDSGEISFPSLDVPPTDDSSADHSQVVPMPPPILTDYRRPRQYEASQNQEVMLCTPNMYRATSAQRPEQPTLLPNATEGEEEKVEVEPNTMDSKLDELSTNTEESTDFSSIGKNAGLNTASLYWKQQLGLGIEVINMADSLVVSPNSDCGLTSFDLSKTPSPKRSKTSFNGVTDKIPLQVVERKSTQQNLYSRKSSHEHDTYSAESEPERRDPYPLRGGVRTDPLPLRKNCTSTSTDQTKQCHQASQWQRSSKSSLRIQNDHTIPSPPSSPVKSMTMDPLLFRRASSQRSRASSTSQASKELAETHGRVSPRGSQHVKFSEKSNLASNNVKKQVNLFSKPGSKIGSLPRTPTRTRGKLMNLMHKFDPKSVVAADDLETI